MGMVTEMVMVMVMAVMEMVEVTEVEMVEGMVVDIGAIIK